MKSMTMEIPRVCGGAQRDVDTELRMALLADVERGFEALVVTYQHRLYGFALRLCGQPQDAEEIAQEAFVRAYRALCEYPAERIQTMALRSWLYQIALNVLRNRVRGRHVSYVSLDAPMSVGESESAPREIAGDESDWPQEALEVAEQRRELATAILTLPQHLRIALVLRHVEGLSYGEMADLLGQPIGTIKSHVHRGALLLREALRASEAVR